MRILFHLKLLDKTRAGTITTSWSAVVSTPNAFAGP